MRLIANAKVIDGKLILAQRNEFLKEVKNFEGYEIVIIIERRTKKRSLKQNNYYWGVVVPLTKEGMIGVGYRMTDESMHEYLKAHFNIIEIVNERSGEIQKSIGSTKEMTTVQMKTYFEKITQWSAEYLEVEIPEPNEQLEIKYQTT